MAKVNNKTKGFNSISRELVFDNVLSDRARFVYVYMACKPEGWEFYQDKVAEELGYKKATLRKYLDELIMRGWIVEEEQENEGKFGALQYTIENERNGGENLPIRKKPDTQKTRYGKNHNQKDIDNNSSTINSPTIKDIEKKNILSNDNNKSDELFDLFWKKYKQGSKKAALKAWNKLKDKQKESSLNNVDDYLIYCKRSGRQLKDASTYLNGECFNDDWTAIPDCYQVGDFDDEQTKRFKQYMVKKFPDVIYHRNPLTYEQCYKLIEEYGPEQFEEAMRRLCGRDIHQYYSVKIGVETILKEMQDDNI